MKKILIVDDEYLIRYSLSATFTSSSAEVITAADGKAALKASTRTALIYAFLISISPIWTGSRS